LVERYQRVAEPVDAGLVAERLAQRLAERDRGVLDGVVRVYLDVAVRADPQVNAAVLAELAQHVVEERHAGRDIAGTRAVEVEFDFHPGFLGRAPHQRRPVAHRAGHVSTASSACLNASFSSGVPMLTRSQPGGPTSLTRTPRSSSACQIARRRSNVPNSTKLVSDS